MCTRAGCSRWLSPGEPTLGRWVVSADARAEAIERVAAVWSGYGRHAQRAAINAYYTDRGVVEAEHPLVVLVEQRHHLKGVEARPPEPVEDLQRTGTDRAPGGGSVVPRSPSADSRSAVVVPSSERDVVSPAEWRRVALWRGEDATDSPQ